MKNSNRAVVAFVAALAILPGCLQLSNPGEGAHQAADEPGSPEAGARLELLGCTQLILGMVADEATVAKVLPTGYSPAGLAPGTGDVNLEVFHCEKVVAGNMTVVTGVSISLTLAFVDAPDDVAGPGVDLFLLEASVSNETISNVFAANGMEAPVGSATISFASPGMASAQVEVDSSRSYAASVGVFDGSLRSDESTRKLHYQASVGPAWVFANSTNERLGEFFRGGELMAEGGILSQLTIGTQGHHVLVGQAATFDSIYEFGKKD